MADEIDNIEQTNDNEPAAVQVAENGAGQSSPEDTSRDWQTVAETQQKTIDSLISNIESLNNQIARLVQSGAQITDGSSPKQGNNSQFANVPTTQSMSEGYTPLKDLGKLIGKQD